MSLFQKAALHECQRRRGFVRSSRQRIGCIARTLLILGALCVVSGQAIAKLATEESRAYYEKALEQVKQGNARAAVIELKNALEQDPSNADARLLLGDLYLLSGDGASAEKEFKEAERYGVDASRTIVPLGRALLLQDRFTDILSGFDPKSYGPDIGLEVRLLRAEASAGLGQLAEARSVYEDAQGSNPKNARIPLGLARIDLLEGKFNGVETHAVEALALTPDLPEATLLRAEARRQSGKPEDAVALYRAVLDGKPGPYQIKARAHIGLAAALMSLNRNTDAETEVHAFQSIVPKSPLGPYLAALIKVRARDFPAARQILENAAPTLESFTPAGFLYGMVNFAAGEYETARAWLNRHLRDHPENLPARKLQGATLLQLDAISDAIAVLQPGLKQAPDDPQLLLLLGSAYNRAGRATEATDLLKRAAELAPQDPRVLSQLAVNYVATGQNDEALSVLDTTLDLDADAGAVGYALAFVHLRSGRFEEALKVAQNLRQHLPNSAVAANLEGAAYAGLGRPADAQASLDAALQIEPNYHEARANLAALKVKAGDLNGAENEYSRIVASDEKNVPALLGLAGIAQRRSDTATSRNWLAKAVEADPRAIGPAMKLAENYAVAGELLAAMAVVNALAQQHPDNPQVLFTLGRLQSQTGRYTDAIETYKRLVDVSKRTSEARMLLAQTYLAAGEDGAARRVLEESVVDDPEHRATVEALVRLVSKQEGQEASFAYAEGLEKRFPDAVWSNQLIGDVYWSAGRFEEAIADYEAGWAKKPSANLAIALSRARMQLATQRRVSRDEALAPLQQWLKDHPADDTVRLVLAEGELALGDLAAATKEYEALKATQANNPTVWNSLAWLYQQAGDKRAAEHGERAFELSPNQPEILDTLGWILLAHGQVDRATALLRQAHLNAPDSNVIAFHYAVTLHTGGDDASAERLLQSLLKNGEPFAEKSDAEKLLDKISR